MTTDCFRSVDDACQRLCIGRSKFYQLVREGRIEIRKIGSRSVVPVEPRGVLGIAAASAREGGVMISESCNWTDYRARFGLLPEDEIDLHRGRRDPGQLTYDDAMSEVEETVRTALEQASKCGRPYVMFVHGNSTSRPGRQTARSVVRGFMRSKAATPFIDRAGCIQHQTVFIAKLRAAS